MELQTGEDERREEGEAFWINIRKQLESGEASSASSSDKNTVVTLASGQKARGWMSMIPIGLVSSYRYLYDCVKGLGCEDADIIERDVLRTVGAVKDGPGVFGDTSDIGKAGKARAMHRVLTAISITDSMGYCQGMNYVVDFLLKMVNEEDAFCLFLYALRNKHLCCLYETKLPVLSDYMEIYERQLSHRLPDLAQHLKEHGFIAPFYSIEWFTTLFVLSCPFELTVAIWDLFFMGFKDVQVRCAVALMESIEPSLMLMGTEELLKNFRTVALYKVNATDVILRALKLDLAPVKVGSPDLYGQPTANGVNQENHNYSTPPGSDSSPSSSSKCFLIDPRGKVRDDEGGSDSAEPGATPQSSGSNLQGDILLTLRLRYLRKAREAMQERDVTTGRWAQEQLQRGHELLQQQHQLQKEEETKATACIHNLNESAVESSSTNAPNDEEVDVMSDEEIEALETLERSYSNNSTRSPVQVNFADADNCFENEKTEANEEFKSGFTVNQYFEFLVDGELMSKAYALKEVVSSCDRITQWVHLNQKWADCLEFMENKLSQYNMADHMLRYAITINAHIRVISFFLAVAGADPNSQDRWLRTPLHFAAVHNRPDVVRVLLLAGADSSIPGALNKSLLIAPSTSSLSGALKSGRMVTPTVLCQATYGNSLSSVPAALTILKGKACILCNTLEATSLASVAKRRHSRILNTRIPNMQVQASVRSNETLNTAPEISGKIVISNCPKCNIPMCAWCLPDHHCIFDIIQEEFTWKVNLVKARTTSKSSDTSSLGSSIGNGKDVVDGNAHSSKKGSKALRRLGKSLFQRRPTIFGRFNREKEVIRRIDDADSDISVESDSDDSLDSCSTASGELLSPEDSADFRRDFNNEHNVEEVADIIRNSEVSVDHTSIRDSDSIDSGFDVSTSKKEELLQGDTESGITTPAYDSNILSSPKVMFKSMFKRERSGTPSSTDSPSASVECSGNVAATSSKKKVAFSGGLKKMKARMSRKKSVHSDELLEDVDVPKGGMPMYWIGYRDEANRQATLQPWQIVLLPLVQGGEYNRVLHRSGRSSHGGSSETLKMSRWQAGPDSDDDSEDDGNEGFGTRLKTIRSTTKNEPQHAAADLECDSRVCDEEIHRQVREIYQNSLQYPTSNSRSYTKRKEPKYLHFVSEMEGLYRTLERDATEIFSIEPLPAPPPMITSVTASYLHVKHHKHPRSSTSSVQSTKTSFNEIDDVKDVKSSEDDDKFDSWDGVLIPEDRVWVDSSAVVDNRKNEAEHIDSPVINNVPAFRSITAFSTDLEPARSDAKGNHAGLELTEKDAKIADTTVDVTDAEARFQQQLQIKGMNGLKKDALKKFLSGSWKLSEDDDMWVPDECAWYCRKCSEQFSLFKRKHHCRRCGNVFCDEDAPRVDASECLHESLQQAYQGVMKEEFGKKKEKIQFRLCMSCKNEIRHSVGLYIELDFLLPRYNFSTWLISLLSKTYNNMCQSSRSAASPSHANGSIEGNSELKNVRLKKFAVAGHWMDSMADWLWRDRQLQLDNT